MIEPRPGPPPSTKEIEQEAHRIVDIAIDAGLRVRLMGGLAVLIQSPTSRRVPYARTHRDIDIVAHARDVGALRRLLEGDGYVGDRLFNAVHGAQRLIYAEPASRWTVDVVLDRLAMSHTLDLRDRLATDGPTLDLADLLLTKLQIWETNRKDLADAGCLLADHPLQSVGRPVAAPGSDGAAAPIDLVRVRSVLGADWGFCHTAERNLAAVADFWRQAPIAGIDRTVEDQVDRLLAEISAAPKSIAWKTRARIGERVRWYETPEEARR